MDESWRFRPAQGHLCPVCSIPHFPFCPMPPPPPHAFDRYCPAPDDLRRFPPPGLAPQFPHDPPFCDHRAPPPMPYPLEPWGVNHAPEREPLRPVVHPPQRFLQDEFLGRETSYKRMRIEDPPMGSSHPTSSYDRYDFVPGRISTDDERRLNLIRDHGKQNTMEGLPQSNGEFLPDRFVHDGPLLPDRFARDAPQNQYRDVRPDYGFDGPRINSVGRSAPVLPPEPTFALQNQFSRSNPFEEHPNFPGSISQGIDWVVSHERLDFERVGAYDAHLGEYRNAHYERKDFGRGSEAGDYANVRKVHSDVPFQPYDSYLDGGSVPSSGYNAAHGTKERPFPVKGQQAAYPMSDYIPQGQFEQYDRHDFQELHPSKDSPYALPKQPQYSELRSYHLARDPVGYDQKRSYPESRFEIPSQQTEAIRFPPETKLPDANDIHRSVNHPLVEQSNAKNHVVHGGFPPLPGTNNSNGMMKEMHGRIHPPGLYPSLSPSSLPAAHIEPSLKHISVTSSTPSVPPPPTLFPVLASASAVTSLPANRTFSDPHALPRASGYSEQPSHPSIEIATEDLSLIHQAPLNQYQEEAPKVSVNHSVKSKPTTVDACELFKQPHCASRPDHIVIILRGLPGSGKSYLAKALRDLEIENGGNAPRIHAMDDYFMIEVEKKSDDNEGSSSSSRVKKQTTKKVIEYCYEPEMEEAYRSSMLKAFKKTLEEGIFTFIIVDDRNLRVADFAQFWAIAKRSGYEVYLLEAPYKDPTGCAARNVHGFTLEGIQKMAEKWEEAPPLYLQLNIQSLFRGDDLNEHSIQEVDMDINDSDCDDDGTKLQDEESLKPSEPNSVDYVPDQDSSKAGERWNSEEEEEEQTRIRELGSSKWSKDLDEDIENSEGIGGNLNALSGLIQAYGKNGKCVHWGDQVDKSGFSIGAMKKQSSLIIGPGSGYNLASNPLVEDQDAVEASESSSMSESKRRFSEKLRAEHESFRAVFNKRRQRIGGFFNIEDD